MCASSLRPSAHHYLDLRQLSLFVAVAETLSFTRAAQRMHISQPPLSRHIAKLEEHLGMRLLERSRHSVALTPAGQVFLPEARRILALAAEAPEIVRRFERGEQGSLRIGFVHATIYTSVPTLLRCYRHLYPDVDIQLHQLAVARQVEMLLADELDIGLIRHRLVHTELHTRELFSEPQLVALPSDHPLAVLPRVAVRELAGEDFISYSRREASASYEQLLRICQEAGFIPRIVTEAAPLSTLVGLVAAGAGIAIVPQSMNKLNMKNVVYRPLDGTSICSEFFLAWRRDKKVPTLSNFLDMVDKQPSI